MIRERHTAALLAFTRDIASAAAPADVAAVTVRHLEDSLPIGASILLPDPDEPGTLAAAAGLMPLARQEQAVARWAFDHREPAGLGTDTLPGARVLAVPLIAGEHAVGVIAVQARQDPRRRGGASLPLLEAFARQAGLALARVPLRGAGPRGRAPRPRPRSSAARSCRRSRTISARRSR